MLKDSTQEEKAALWEQEQTPESAGLCCQHEAGAAWQAQGALIPSWIQQELSTSRQSALACRHCSVQEGPWQAEPGRGDLRAQLSLCRCQRARGRQSPSLALSGIAPHLSFSQHIAVLDGEWILRNRKSVDWILGESCSNLKKKKKSKKGSDQRPVRYGKQVQIAENSHGHDPSSAKQ